MRTPTRCCCTHQHSNCNCICVAQVKATNNITFIPTIWCHGSAPGNTKLSFLFYFVPFESEISTPQWYLVALPLLDEQCWWMLYSARVFLFFFFRSAQNIRSFSSRNHLFYSPWWVNNMPKIHSGAYNNTSCYLSSVYVFSSLGAHWQQFGERKKIFIDCHLCVPLLNMRCYTVV